VYSFSYTNGLLSRISYKGTGTEELYHVAYSYIGSNLTGITYKDDETCSFAYEGSRLASATDIDGYTLSYNYNTVSEDYQPYRVQSVSAEENNQSGGSLDFTYAHNQTTLEDHNGNVSILQFNDFGNLTCVQDDEGRAQFTQYAFNTDAQKQNNQDSTAKSNQLRVSSDLQYTVANVLPDNNMRFTSSGWTGYGQFVFSEITTERCYADLSALSVICDGPNSGVGTGVTLAPGQTQTFSCYVASDECGVYLMAECSGMEIKSLTQPMDNAWYRLQVSYTNDSNEACTVYYYVLSDNAGTFFMDCPQLENAPTSSRYNLMNNGDFNTAVTSHQWKSTGFATGDGVTSITTSAVKQLDNRVLKIVGNPTTQKRYTQTVFVDGNTGDYYTIAGWAKGNSAPIEEGSDREFAIEAVILYADGTKSAPFTANFNTDTDDWQYTATGILAEKEFWKIEVSLIYSNNVNTVYFDGIQLFKDGFGAKLEYDEDGNVISILESNNKSSSYEYTENDLTREILTTGAELTYEYDDYHNVKTATTEEGLIYTFTYDAWGNNTSVSISNTGEGAEDAPVTMSSTAVYTADGNRLVSTTDATGRTTTYGYNEQTNLLEWVQAPGDDANTRTRYTYDSMNRIKTVQANTDTNLALSATYTYEKDLLKGIQTPSTNYSFTYGKFSLRTGVSVGERTLATYTYTDDANSYLSRLDYGNGDRVQYTYDDKGRVTREAYEDGTTVTYAYDNAGSVATVTDTASGTTATYGYDYIDRLSVYEEKRQDVEVTLTYSYYVSNKQLKTLLEVINGHPRGASYIYDNDERLTSYQKANSKREYHYDDYDRLYSYSSTLKNAEGTFDNILTTDYTFYGTENTTTSGQVSGLQQTGTNFSIAYSYTYDENGNILSVSDGTNTTSYTYDSANQLIRENNQAGDFTYTWTYDSAGNILNRKEYAYTTGDLGEAVKTVSYTYGDDDWGDLLTAYDGVAITYDEIGNPLTHGSRSYTWKHGRQLATLREDGVTWTYTYNADGLRTKRTNGTKTYNYVYYGGNLQYMSINGSPLYFTHAPDGTVMGILYDSRAFFYVTNLQGDVVGIADDNGQLVVSYTYDAWGNILSITGSMANSLGQLNPFRYRGYVYDTETKLYYIESRYYNPEVGRFINADDIDLLGANSDFASLNLFIYCGNNPVSRADHNGQLWGIALGAVIKAAVSAAVNVATTYIAAKVTGQEYTLADARVAAISGMANTVHPYYGPLISGAITGLYTGTMAVRNGASIGGAISSGVVAGICTTASIGNLASISTPDLTLATTASVDLVFGTGYNCISAATYKTVTSTDSPLMGAKTSITKHSSKALSSNSLDQYDRAFSGGGSAAVRAFILSGG